MPVYHKLGKTPHKRHTQFRRTDGELYAEELVSTEGFSSMYSLVYHTYPPTMIKEMGEPYSVEPHIAAERHMKHQSFNGFDIAPEIDYISSRQPILVNSDVHLCLAAPTQSMSDYFYKNADADELIFVHKGNGKLLSMFGELKFEYGDYMIIPRGTIYKIEFESSDNRLLIIESFSPLHTPKKYRNKHGQLQEHSPFYERDYKLPQNLKTFDEKGEFLIKIKKQGYIYPYIYATHPFDAIGWDGFHYPWAISIHDFEPITGRVHQPPPVHQNFEANNFVVCSFCPRMFDYHPDSIPAPYAHSNVDSDEVLYYVDGDFMSRKHVEKGQITLHPGGIPHGPHPGTAEKSIGVKETLELAVMVDTFRPLMITEEGMKICDENYYQSWIE